MRIPFEDTVVELADGEVLEVFVSHAGTGFSLTARARNAIGRRTIRTENVIVPGGPAPLGVALSQARALARKHHGVVVHPDGTRETL